MLAQFLLLPKHTAQRRPSTLPPALRSGADTAKADRRHPPLARAAHATRCARVVAWVLALAVAAPTAVPAGASTQLRTARLEVSLTITTTCAASTGRSAGAAPPPVTVSCRPDTPYAVLRERTSALSGPASPATSDAGPSDSVEGDMVTLFY